ncbi:hypothetical protein ACFORL_02335 [Legionella dresdenensis]|uniref:Tfp pilus assembly protein PilX n=1 Tax=Legionella dresdenensis TaxID=450200 RepID=A0ABV8CCN8_9GAMM
MSNRRQQGVVLFTTLLIISLLALLVLSQLKVVALHARSIAIVVEQRKNFSKLEQHANQLFAERNSINPGCIIDEASPNQIIRRLAAGQGCQISSNGEQYRFFLEYAGFLPCLIIENELGLFSSEHWRLTIQAFASVLQIRYASAGQYKPCLSQKAVPAKAGIISWRYLPAIESSLCET